jgi:transcriptional regulator with XRE-family HTH domain
MEARGKGSQLRHHAATKGSHKGIWLGLRDARKSAGLTQERLAFKAGIHPTYLSQVERGVKSPSVDVVGSIAHALHLKAHLLMRSAEEGLD